MIIKINNLYVDEFSIDSYTNKIILRLATDIDHADEFSKVEAEFYTETIRKLIGNASISIVENKGDNNE